MVRKLLLSCLIVILSWNAFSQNVTEIKDTTGITLTTDVARRVAVDLVGGDEARREVELLSQETEKLKSLVALQDSLGVMKENQITSLEKVIELQKIQNQQNLEEYSRLNKELQKQTTLKVVFETTTGITVVALLATLLFGGK